MKEQVVVKSGASLGELVFVILLILKLTGNIAMGWFWVLTSFIWAPILTTIVLFIVIFGGLFLLGLLAFLFK